MQSNIDVDIIEADILKIGESLLDILLKDRTTNRNIVWATNDYAALGSEYNSKCEIKTNLITVANSKVIQPRVTKTQKHQNNRTKDKAEVFTPLWICNEQNNLVDEQWFGRKGIFNIQQKQSWHPTTSKIKFSNEKGRTWKHYVDARRMEICCGEAPYLASRYDSVSGDTIELQYRIGLLDRKLRVVNENVDVISEWLKWTERAFQSVYGYEYQGDNLLLARENLLYTFVDNMIYKFERIPTLNECKKIATIISWNIWQMDGTTYTVPFGEIEESYKQFTIFDFMNNNDKHEQHMCKIKDWRSKVIIEYASLMGEKNG